MTVVRSVWAPPTRGAALASPRVHPLLRRLFAALVQRELSWVLLRAPSDLEAPTGDVDLLVAPEHAGSLRDAAETVGFVVLPGWESPPNLLLISFDVDSGRWLVLDVVTELFASSPRGWRSPVAANEVLRNRRLRDGIAVPSRADSFWLLLVHCLLDKNVVAQRYRERLVDLAPAAPQSLLGQTVTSLAAGCSPAGLAEAVLRERWEAVEELRPRLAAGVRRSRSVRDRVRVLTLGLLATARWPLLLRRRRGVSVALVGPNGVGKSTLAASLQREFPLDSRVVYMGLWKGADGGAGRALANALTRPLLVWHGYLSAQLHQARGRLVIFDRYTYEAALPARPPLQSLKRPYHWLLAHAVPSADAVVVLDVDGRIAYARKQENPPEELEWERGIYRGLASKIPGLEMVDASRQPDAVMAEVMAIVWRRSVARWRREPRGARASCSMRDRRGLAAACSLVPRILDAERVSAPKHVRRSIVEKAEATLTRRGLVTLAPVGEPPSAVLKMPLTGEGRGELARERELLAALHAEERLGDWRRLVPRPLAEGSTLEQPYLIESALTGQTLVDRLHDPVMRGRMLDAAAQAIRFLHVRTGCARAVDSRLAERWVDARLEDLARSGASRHPRFHARAARLSEELLGALRDRTLTLSWVHGDYWPGNLLFSPVDLMLTGIVDWDAADPADLPMHDFMHLVLSTRRILTGEELGRMVRRRLRSRGFPPDERELLSQIPGWPPADLESERHALLLYWLRQAAAHARQNGCSGGHRYGLWEMRNVHPVLAAL